MITDLEYHAHDHEHESFGDLAKPSPVPDKLSASAISDTRRPTPEP